jgi:hypothetical protein
MQPRFLQLPPKSIAEAIMRKECQRRREVANAFLLGAISGAVVVTLLFVWLAVNLKGL